MRSKSRGIPRITHISYKKTILGKSHMHLRFEMTIIHHPGSHVPANHHNVHVFLHRNRTFFLRLTTHKKTDRKSTRLNSSHVAISYAVFCLKKKKQKQNTQHKSPVHSTP